jgi:hypothetical protein
VNNDKEKENLFLMLRNVFERFADVVILRRGRDLDEHVAQLLAENGEIRRRLEIARRNAVARKRQRTRHICTRRCDTTLTC